MAMSTETRTEMVTIRLTTEEHARAAAVAEHHGVNIASLFRMLVKREARDIGLEPKATK